MSKVPDIYKKQLIKKLEAKYSYAYAYIKKTRKNFLKTLEMRIEPVLKNRTQKIMHPDT